MGEQVIPIPHDLMAAILARPEDDLPRLVAADWLEENGEGERAAFIRTQCSAGSKYTVFVNDVKEAPPYSYWFGSVKGFSIEIRRGFPDSVRLSLADFMPGECGECNGMGESIHIAGIEVRGEITTVTRVFNMKCPSCHGTGKRPGLAKVIGGWPVTRIEFSDRGPQANRLIANDQEIYLFWRQGSSSTWHIPPEIFDRIEFGGPSKDYAAFSTRELAISALSTAAIRFARGEWERHVSLDADLCGK